MRRLQHRLVWILIVYCFFGTVSQMTLPEVDEIFPFFGVVPVLQGTQSTQPV